MANQPKTKRVICRKCGQKAQIPEYARVTGEHKTVCGFITFDRHVLHCGGNFKIDRAADVLITVRSKRVRGLSKKAKAYISKGTARANKPDSPTDDFEAKNFWPCVHDLKDQGFSVIDGNGVRI